MKPIGVSILDGPVARLSDLWPAAMGSYTQLKTVAAVK
jgi:hypothetical protein